ncbi:MAG: response regulator transcription factor [Proteobacteria bacterium]|nr:MAG: response regulator transcription factor [Pseudomonadota bacterium]
MEKREMQFELVVIGERLFTTLSDKADEFEEAMRHLCRHTDAVVPTLIKMDHRPQFNDLLLQDNVIRVLLVEARDLSIVEIIQAMERKELAFLNHPGTSLPRLAPLIAVFDTPAVLADVSDLPELISDWTFLPFDPSELARRIHATLKRKNILKTKIRYGALSVVSETRTMIFFGNTMQLTRSECALAELFLNQMGTVIPLADLALLFKSTGKSTTGSNIRVTVFQLRLKLEMLTKGQYTVMSVYKQGYCLKQKTRSTIKEISDNLDARYRGSARFVS